MAFYARNTRADWKIKKAGKEYKCACCKEEIKKGMEYYNTGSKYVQICVSCMEEIKSLPGETRFIDISRYKK